MGSLVSAFCNQQAQSQCFSGWRPRQCSALMFERRLVCFHKARCEAKLSYFSAWLKKSSPVPLCLYLNLDVDHLLVLPSYCLGCFCFFIRTPFTLLLFETAVPDLNANAPSDSTNMLDIYQVIFNILIL